MTFLSQNHIEKLKMGRDAARRIVSSGKIHCDLTVKQKQTVKRVSEYAPSRVKVFLMAYKGVSKAAALKAKCLECCNLETSAISECKIEGCPLWKIRPYRNRKNDAENSAEKEE